MIIKSDDFVKSAQSLVGVHTCQELESWFEERKKFYAFQIEPVNFSQVNGWNVSPDPSRGLQIEHASGKFFQIVGIRVCVTASDGTEDSWDQPIIIQNEIGILGFLVKKIDGVLHFLVQAKMEPGNIDYIQLSPTVQATRSNILQTHGGRRPKYVDYFLNASAKNVLVDTLQSEQGSRFLAKRNRNVVVAVDENVPEDDDFCWLTLGQLGYFLRKNNVVNMDSRTVLGCLPFEFDPEVNDGADSISLEAQAAPLSRSVLQTLRKTINVEKYREDMRWLTSHKFLCDSRIEFIGLDALQGWTFSDSEIYRNDHDKFSVLAANIHAVSREVSSWAQPFMKSATNGLMASPVRIDAEGNLEVLTQAKYESGVSDQIEIGPAVQWFPENKTRVPLPFLVDEFLSNRLGRVVVDTMQSEEGGRFFREQNRNLFVLIDYDEIRDVPENYRWISLDRLKFMTNHTRVVNIELRCLLASLTSLIGSFE